MKSATWSNTIITYTYIRKQYKWEKKFGVWFI